MDISFIEKFAPMYAKAALLTIWVALAGILLSIVVGLLCALVKYYKIKGLQHLVGSYIELSRNTPLLIQLFFLYFALPNLGIKLSSLQCCVIGLTFLGGSYMEETFRSALESVGKTQIESDVYRPHESADDALRYFATGAECEHSRILRECHVLDKGNVGVQHCCCRRLDVCRKGLNRSLLQDGRSAFDARYFVFRFAFANYGFELFCRKEASLCSIRK